MAPRPITFLTDFGREGVYVGLCHAVMAAIAPAAPVADLTHDIPPQDVQSGAMALADCVPYVPAAVHLAVVDPGVGSHRRGVVLLAGDALLVGPDNGLLLPAAQRLGGVTAGYQLSDRRFQAAEVSRTFHGRDVFAPAAAHLAAGVPPQEFGDEIDLDGLVDLALPVAAVNGHVVAAPVRDIDRFGNVQLAATPADLARASVSGIQRLQIRVPRRTRRSLGRASALRFLTGQETSSSRSASAPRASERLEEPSAQETFEIRQVGTYSDLEHGELGLLVDSFGWLAVVMDRDNAAQRLGVHELDVVKLVAS